MKSGANRRPSGRAWIKPAAGSLVCILACLFAWIFPQWKAIASILWFIGTVLIFSEIFRGGPDRRPGSLLTKWAMTAVISTAGYLIFS
jgi:hypothetical protein